MIEMFLAVTIVLVLGGIALLAMFAAPWWMTVLVIAGAVLLIDKMFKRITRSGKGGD
jgi:hypothetical protein